MYACSTSSKVGLRIVRSWTDGAGVDRDRERHALTKDEHLPQDDLLVEPSTGQVVGVGVVHRALEVAWRLGLIAPTTGT